MNQLKEVEKLFRENHKSLCNVSYGVVKDRQVSKDIVQDVFFQFWKSRDKLDLGAGIKSYLYKATINLSINYIKKVKRMSVLAQQGLVKNPEGSETPHESTVANELQLNIDKAINNLPARCQTIFLMSRYEGMKYQEIADTMGLSVKTVENQMGIALKKLREDLEPFLITSSIIILLGMLFYLLF